ncbi:CDP-alcohol phosphatidyltransferase family protein [Actinokineospora sp. 24-640]
MTPPQHTPAPDRTTLTEGELAAWAGAHLVLLGLLGATVGLGATGWAVGTAYCAATVALLRRAMRRHGISSPGPANRITLARGALVGAVAAHVADGAVVTPLVVTLASVALALDFVDGQVARRTGTASALGARFDMEVDAFLILVLSAQVAAGVGPWVLLIGAMRYLFVAASWVLPWLRAGLPPSVARKAVAALQGVLLVVAASGVVPLGGVIAGLALAALLWSFGRDGAWLWRTRP